MHKLIIKSKLKVYNAIQGLCIDKPPCSPIQNIETLSVDID